MPRSRSNVPPASRTYGLWKVTERELATAKSWVADLPASDPASEGAYQLIRYCQGQVHIRADAEEALKLIRG
jgi:hypothetical protein